MAPRFLLLILCLLLTGCTATRSFLGVSPKADREFSGEGPESSRNDSTDLPGSESASAIYGRFDIALRAELEGWHGTPHIMGGNSKTGVDCSGLIKQVYADLLEVHTSRTTGQLIREGKSVRKSKLKTGDLVFFTPESKKGGHAGIYLSNGEFTHASSSRGVMTSKLSNPYWTRYYETGRRIIPDITSLRRALARIETRNELARALQSNSK